MSTLGIHVTTGFTYYCILDGTKSSPNLIDKGRIQTADHKNVVELMSWYENEFTLLINTHKPTNISYRLTLSPGKKQQLHTLIMPLGILNLVAHKNNLPIEEFSSMQFNHTRLGLPKGTDIIAHCDIVFGTHPPYWNPPQRYALLAAWFTL